MEFTFIERLKIYSLLELQIPKELQEYIRKQVILSVTIPHADDGQHYKGYGIIKAVRVLKN